MKRVEQGILIVSFLAFCWLGMQAVHELGHVVGAWLTGAEILKVALHPCVFSQTFLGENPHPLIVVWAGPLAGSALPLLAFGIAKLCRAGGVYMFRVFAGFCLMANGIYIAFGSTDGLTDPAVMIEHNCPYWLMLAFGLVTIPTGLYLWHRQGRYVGLGTAHGAVSREATVVSVVLFVLLVTAELLINSR